MALTVLQLRFKAQYFAQFIARNYSQSDFICPELSDLPEKAIETLSKLIDKHTHHIKIALIGSSLGGFYATWLAQKYDLSAALINPAVNPQELLLDYLGKNQNYHTGEEYEFTLEHIRQLDVLQVQNLLSPKKFMVLLQTDDEVLDYRLAETKYAQTHIIIEFGGNHSFQNFADHCEAIVQFLLSS